MNQFALTDNELQQFHQNGYIGPFTLYEADAMRQLLKPLRRQLLDTTHVIHRGDNNAHGVTNLSNYDRHLDIPFLFDHIKQPQIVDRVSSILGSNLLCWRSEFFAKYPGDEGTDWHQVKNFSAVSSNKQADILWPDNANFCGAINVWTALTDTSIENGCLRIIPGTHDVMFYDENKPMPYNQDRINIIEKNGEKRGFFGYDFTDLQVHPDWKPDESKALSLQMQAGQFVIFWSTLLHASHPHSGQPHPMRLGYTARYVPTSVRIYPDKKQLNEFGVKSSLENYRAVLVSGEDTYRHNNTIS